MINRSVFFNLLAKEKLCRLLHIPHRNIICGWNLCENARLAINGLNGSESLVKGLTLFWN
jgi:hypothetical protein